MAKLQGCGYVGNPGGLPTYPQPLLLRLLTL